MQLSIPKEVKDGEMRYSRCEMYDVNFRRYTQRNADDLLSRIVAGNTSDIALGRKACTQWMYDPNSPYTSTIVTEVSVYSNISSGKSSVVYVLYRMNSQSGQRQ